MIVSMINHGSRVIMACPGQNLELRRQCGLVSWLHCFDTFWGTRCPSNAKLLPYVHIICTKTGVFLCLYTSDAYLHVARTTFIPRPAAPNAFGIFVRKPIRLPVTTLIRCIVKHQPVGGHRVATLHQRPMTVRELWNCKLHSFSFGAPFASGLTAVELHVATGGPDFNEGIDATETIHLWQDVISQSNSQLDSSALKPKHLAKFARCDAKPLGTFHPTWCWRQISWPVPGSALKGCLSTWRSQKPSASILKWSKMVKFWLIWRYHQFKASTSTECNENGPALKLKCDPSHGVDEKCVY